MLCVANADGKLRLKSHSKRTNPRHVCQARSPPRSHPRDDFGFLKGHVMAVRKYRKTSPAAPQSPRSPQVGEPIGCAPPSHRALPTQQVPSLHALTIRLSTPQGQAPGRK